MKLKIASITFAFIYLSLPNIGMAEERAVCKKDGLEEHYICCYRPAWGSPLWNKGHECQDPAAQPNDRCKIWDHPVFNVVPQKILRGDEGCKIDKS